jgi:cytosine/adenosine deaminase-related metal-dependent hydrolase
MMAEPLVLAGATLIDVQSGESTPNSALVIEGGRIAWAGRRDELTLPAGARHEDVSGAWLIPGLVDMHVHLKPSPLAVRLLPLYLAHGVTTVRDVGGNITQLALLRDDLAAGRRFGPRHFFAGPLLDAPPLLWPEQTIMVDTPARAHSAVRMLLDQGVDCVKVYNNVREDSLIAIVEESHAGCRMVIGHVPRTLSTSHAVEIGMGCLEHIRVTGRELLSPEEADEIDPLPLGTRETLLWERFDLESPGMARLIEYLAESRVFLDPTLIVDAALFEATPADSAAESVQAALPEDAQEAFFGSDWMDPLRGPDELQVRARAGLGKRLEFISRCNEAGVWLLAGTDTFGPGALLPGASLLNELELLCRAGLSPLQSLRAATVTAATAPGREGELGTLAAGALADALVLGASPLERVSNVRNLLLVVKGGQTYTPASVVGAI